DRIIFVFDSLQHCYYYDTNIKSSKNTWVKIRILYAGSYNIDLRNFAICFQNKYEETSITQGLTRFYTLKIIGGVYRSESRAEYNVDIFKFDTKTGILEQIDDKLKERFETVTGFSLYDTESVDRKILAEQK